MNNIYVFGVRDPGFTGSDFPITSPDHDYWTEAGSDIENWSATVNSGSGKISIPVEFTNLQYATGSWSILTNCNLGDGTSGVIELTLTIPNSPIMLNDSDIVHLYSSGYISSGPGYHYIRDVNIRLKTTDSDYFESLIEDQGAATPGGNWHERTLNCGPAYEGISSTGSIDTTTGSYKWERIGNPDWYNINKFEFVASGSTEFLNNFSLHVDGLYFGTKFQYQTGSTESQTTYGYRPYVYQDNKLTSTQYCQNKAETLLAAGLTPVTQIELTTTGSPALQLGNRYQINIGAENISGYYELIDLEHRLEYGDFTSICTFTDKKELRTIVPIIRYPVQRAQESISFWEALQRVLIRLGIIKPLPLP